MTIRTLIIALGGLLTTAILGVLILIYWLPDSGLTEEESKITVEAAKSLFQLIVVVLIGGTVTACFKAFESSQKETREKEEKLHKQTTFRSEIRVDYLKRVGASYRVAKAARRALRAAGLTNKNNTPPNALSADQITSYQEQMKNLNEAQLELEALKIEASSLPGLVGLQELPDLLESMEDYLRTVVKEYEKFNPILLVESSAVKFEKLKRLKEFTGSASDKDNEGFEKCLATPHDKIIKLVADRTKVAFKPR